MIHRNLQIGLYFQRQDISSSEGRLSISASDAVASANRADTNGLTDNGAMYLRYDSAYGTGIFYGDGFIMDLVEHVRTIVVTNYQWGLLLRM